MLGLISNSHLRYPCFRESSRVASKIPTKLKDLPCEKRLNIWGITSLEEPETRGDLIQSYKILNGLVLFEWYFGFQFISNSLGQQPATQNA